MRNSNVMAIAPTATISNIVGVSQSIEPTYQNLYVKSNLSGEFTMVNPYLRLVVERLDGHDRMTLHCETDQQGEGLVPAIEQSLQAITGLRGSVTLIAPGELANDGKVIDDRRPLD
jgi:ribonucleotide reductase alpha subunit